MIDTVIGREIINQSQTCYIIAFVFSGKLLAEEFTEWGAGLRVFWIKIRVNGAARESRAILSWPAICVVSSPCSRIGFEPAMLTRR
jgi:hypothetical protein